MAREDQVRWDRRHGRGKGIDPPATLLRQIVETDAWLLPRGLALDLACGKGRNALYLAENGFEVVAMDVSAVALAEGKRAAEEKRLSIEWRQTDLEQIELEEGGYDLIVDFNYLQRSLMAQIKRAVRRAGYVVFETYLADQKEIGHPKNPAFLLARNELLEIFRDFRILYYREGRFADAGAISFRAGMLAQRPG